MERAGPERGPRPFFAGLSPRPVRVRRPRGPYFRLAMIRPIPIPIFLLLLLCVCGRTSDAFAQQGPEIGVEWVAPGDFVDAAGDLLEMAEVGFRAVRMPPVYDRGFYDLADSLGLTLYVELPLAALSARDLVQAAAQADSVLTLVLDAGRGFASAGPVGITRMSDTRSAGACPEIARLAGRIRSAGRQAYYSSRFGPADACADAVDFVLLDVLGEPDPIAALGRVLADRSMKGIAGLGVPVTVPGGGWKVAGSPEAQARFMEEALATVMRSELDRVFVHRWRDAERRSADLPDPWGRAYGLYTRNSDPRPALQVVRGILLGIQDTFAFPPGEQPDGQQPWFPLLGWMMLSLTALLYAGNPRFRSMIPRYFFAHGFFRNAVREAREVLPLTSTAILTVTGLSVGLIGSFVITSLRDTALALHMFRMLAAPSREAVTAIMGTPFVLVVLIGSLTLLSTSLWMGSWMAVTSRRARLLPSQALMLASWPRWQVLVLLPLAMTLESVGPVPEWSVLLLGAAWVLTALWATVRTAWDLTLITHVPLPVAAFVWTLHPLVLGSLIGAAWSLFHWDEVRFAWHLIVVG